MTIDLSSVSKQTGDCVIELGARTGSEGSYNYNVDYYADDFTVVCPNAKQPSVFDDTKVDRLKWDFENGATADWVTENRGISQMKDTNRWTRILDKHTASVEDVSTAEFHNTTTNASAPKSDESDAVKTPPIGSSKMLVIDSGKKDTELTKAHISTRIKLSRLDLVPGKTYQMSFYAFGNTDTRSLYMGLVKHSNENLSKYISGKDYHSNNRVPGIIQYDDDPYTSGDNTGSNYRVNYVASMPRSWNKYTVTVSPKEENFDSDGFTDLCIVMTYDRVNKGSWVDKAIYWGEKLYLDEIEITESSSSQVAAIANDGLYTKRATFESDNMDMFSPQTRSSVVLTTAAANTGSYSAEFANRKDNWTSLGSSLKGADLSSKITASCYLKKNSLRA